MSSVVNKRNGKPVQLPPSSIAKASKAPKKMCYGASGEDNGTIVAPEHIAALPRTDAQGVHERISLSDRCHIRAERFNKIKRPRVYYMCRIVSKFTLISSGLE